MKKSGKIRFTGLAVTLVAIYAVWLALAPHPVLAAGESIVVIVNPANPVDNLTIADLKKLFLSDRGHWDTGKAVAPAMLGAGAPERVAFLKIVCGMNDAELGKYFLAASFSGRSVTPPKEVFNRAALKSFVASFPGGIAFIKASELSVRETTVKAVKVEGVAATDPDYKLKM